MGTTIVILDMRVKPEAVAKLKSQLGDILKDTRAYEGCQGVDAYEDIDADGHLLVYERWDSKDHHKKYLGWRAETGFMDQLAQMLAGPPSFTYYERLDA